MAWRTGDACGFTDTRSADSSCSNHNDVMIVTSEAQEAWWPPTLSPLGFGRTRFAWWMIEVDSQSTFSAISWRWSGTTRDESRSAGTMLFMSESSWSRRHVVERRRPGCEALGEVARCQQRTRVDQISASCAIVLFEGVHNARFWLSGRA